jgi:hypothetical protein
MRNAYPPRLRNLVGHRRGRTEITYFSTADRRRRAARSRAARSRAARVSITGYPFTRMKTSGHVGCFGCEMRLRANIG